MTIAFGVARRHVVRLLGAPALLLPSLMVPLLIFAAFAGGASGVSKTPGFDYYNYNSFQFVYVLLMSAGLTGSGTGLAAAQDFESGFARRMMLSVSQRPALIAGYVLAGVLTELFIAAVLTGVALAAGMTIRGGVVDVIGVYAIAILFTAAATLYGTGLAMRVRSVQVGPAMNLPIFLPLFLAPTYAPRQLLTNWLHHIANFNPITALLECGRGFLAGRSVSVAVAFGILAGLFVLTSMYAVTGLHKAEGKS
jgi:ABC-type multidrug transport system permease subunit